MSRSPSTAQRLKEQIVQYEKQRREQRQMFGAQDANALAESVIEAQSAYIQELEYQLMEHSGGLLTLRSMGVI